jgi:membrane protease YdiL (CAAX protease family)
MRPWIARHPIASFYVAAYIYSWVVGVPLALQAQGVWAAGLDPALHYLTAFGPALAALTIRGLLSWRSRSVQDRAGIPRRSRAAWLAVSLLSPLLLFAIAQLAGRLMGQPVPSWRALGQVNFLPDLGLLAWGLWFITSGVGEEVGWRGFALPRLQRSHLALTSSVLLSIAWAGWHLPAFFYLPSYAAIGLRVLPGFFIGILAGAIVLTWLYNSSGGSVLAAILWHASFNFVTGSPNAAGLAAAIASTLVIVWAIAVVWRYGPTTLTSGATVTR